MIANQLRPVSVSLQPLARNLAPAARSLKQAIPSLSGSVGELNTVFNELAYQPGKGSTATCSTAPGSRTSSISLASNQDANGASLQGQLMGNCVSLGCTSITLAPDSPSLGVILALANAARRGPAARRDHHPSPIPAVRLVTCPAS